MTTVEKSDKGVRLTDASTGASVEVALVDVERVLAAAKEAAAPGLTAARLELAAAAQADPIDLRALHEAHASLTRAALALELEREPPARPPEPKP